MPSSPQAARRGLVSDARDLLAACPGLNARAAARRIGAFLDARLAPHGLTLAQLGLLAQGAAAADDTVGGLAAELVLDPSTLSRTLRRLERAGLVGVAVVDSDLRRRAVWLTESGARRLQAAIPAWRRAQRALAARLDAATRDALAAAGRVLAD